MLHSHYEICKDSLSKLAGVRIVNPGLPKSGTKIDTVARRIGFKNPQFFRVWWFTLGLVFGRTRCGVSGGDWRLRTGSKVGPRDLARAGFLVGPK